MSNRSLHFLTPDVLLRAYAAGIFPMAESANSTELHWFDPPVRAIIPLDDDFHVSRSLKRVIKKRPYTVKLNTAFDKIIRACAEAAPDRPTTWINREIVGLYTTLNWRGHAHSIEVWDGDDLAGGLYGVSLGGAFFGESMFSRKRDASKVALVYLVALMRYCGFALLDTQFQTDHLQQFGTHEVTRANYLHLLAGAVKKPVKLAVPKKPDWDYLAGAAAGLSLQPVTQIS
ncbi:MAG TPA: leucyl/phenylalanyl-tRNA--protein transferase [Alphaproteobacteria bacterium]|nr:leucyl/phenylalanyl-tRNA--protein transferase [Alphaproteobacteria bacterium]